MAEEDLIRRAEQLCNLILDTAVEEETSTHVAVYFDEPAAARIHHAAQLLRRRIRAAQPQVLANVSGEK